VISTVDRVGYRRIYRLDSTVRDLSCHCVSYGKNVSLESPHLVAFQFLRKS
jgi:hypothetical protein